jgi:hypothetical protein
VFNRANVVLTSEVCISVVNDDGELESSKIERFKWHDAYTKLNGSMFTELRNVRQHVPTHAHTHGHVFGPTCMGVVIPPADIIM